MFNSLRTRIENTLKNQITEKIFFLHIPKCGGTSISSSMYRKYLTLNKRRDSELIHINTIAAYKTHEILEKETHPEYSINDECSNRVPEQLLLYYMNLQQTRFIDGHVPFCESAYKNFSGSYSFVTILRHPVERWISEYTYNKYRSGDHMKHTANMDIDDYIKSDFGIAQGSQYVLYLGGRLNSCEYRTREAIKRAIDNLKKFKVVGCLEEMDTFIQSYKMRFNISLNVRHKNKNPRPEGYANKIITSEIRSRIEKICEPDMEIFRFMRENLIK